MKILIASPTYDGSVRREYMRSVMVMTDYFRQAGIEWDLRMESATLLHVMRSVMASKALLDGDITHILFVDTDMGFGASAVKKLIAAKRDVIGCACPYRTIPLHLQVGGGERTLRQAISEALPYAIRFREGQDIAINDGVCEVQSIGTGILLVSTAALAQMKDKVGQYQNHFPYDQWFRHPHYFGFFEPVVVDGRHLGEDYSFCRRWTEDCGGKIYAVVDEEIMHVGSLPVLGRYLDRIKSGKT